MHSNYLFFCLTADVAPNNILYVNNLSFIAKEKNLKKVFPKAVRIRIPKSKGQSKGWVWVRYPVFISTRIVVTCSENIFGFFQICICRVCDCGRCWKSLEVIQRQENMQKGIQCKFLWKSRKEREEWYVYFPQHTHLHMVGSESVKFLFVENTLAWRFTLHHSVIASKKKRVLRLFFLFSCIKDPRGEEPLWEHDSRDSTKCLRRRSLCTNHSR